MLLHDEGARILKLIEEKKGGIKNLVFNSKFKNKGKLNALVCETIKYSTVAKEIIVNSDIQKRARNLKDEHLCRIVIYEFLFGKSENLPDKYLDAVKKNSSSLNAELAKIKIKMKVSDNKDLVDSENKVKLPRYVRVNTLNMKINEVVDHFKGEKYTLVPSSAVDYESFLEKVSNLKEKEFIKDPHVPELLIFQHGTSFHNHPLYEKGILLLQDKASCLPALALTPPQNSQVIDTCAAPGNKTSYLASLMNNTGKIYAFDKDSKRFNTMGAMLLKSKVLNVEMKNEDFLKIKSCDTKYSNVEYILVDPSCSGSGIVDRIDLTGYDLNGESSDLEKLESRLTALSNFQAKLLNHALTFPKVKKAIYSTCSIHEQENENVVREVLSKNPSFELLRLFPKIPSRGLRKEGEANDFDTSSCIRLNPGKDLTNGFFVACLVKKKDSPCGKTLDKPGKTVKANSETRKRKPSGELRDGESTSQGTAEERAKRKKSNEEKSSSGITDGTGDVVCGGAGSSREDKTRKERKLLKKRQRPKHKKPIIFLDKNAKTAEVN